MSRATFGYQRQRLEVDGSGGGGQQRRRRQGGVITWCDYDGGASKDRVLDPM
jgi:hypothetical protein